MCLPWIAVDEGVAGSEDQIVYDSPFAQVAAQEQQRQQEQTSPGQQEQLRPGQKGWLGNLILDAGQNISHAMESAEPSPRSGNNLAVEIEALLESLSDLQINGIEICGLCGAGGFGTVRVATLRVRLPA